MASTYPLEIVEAARWSKEHPDVKGDAVAGAVQSQSWDASVKSLVAFPEVLTMMNEKIDWTQKLGDAFLAQQKEVMQTTQVLRNKAKEAGNLKSSKEQVVKTEPAPAGAPAPQTIIIESKDPEVVYVPTYNPTVVYGAWAYPAYPPYYYYPPYYAGGAFFSFSMGVIVGGAIWGNCNWGGNDVDIDINRQNNFNRNEINNNRNSNNRGNTANTNNRAGNNSAGTKQSWNHDSSHRKGVGYRDSGTQQKYKGGASQQNVAARDQYRGRAEQGRQQMSREGTSNQRDMAGNQVGTRDSAGSRDRGTPPAIAPAIPAREAATTEAAARIAPAPAAVAAITAARPRHAPRARLEVAAAPAPAPPAAEVACREAVAAGGGVDLEEMKVRTKLFVLLACLAPLSFAALPKDQQSLHHAGSGGAGAGQGGAGQGHRGPGETVRTAG